MLKLLTLRGNPGLATVRAVMLGTMRMYYNFAGLKLEVVVFLVMPFFDTFYYGHYIKKHE